MSRYRNRNSLQNTLKDYLVPIIGGVILLLIIFRMFSGDSSKTPETPSTNTWSNSNALDISFASEGAEAFVVYPGDSKQQINDSTDLYKGETLIVKSGQVKLESVSGDKITLNKIAELTYADKQSFTLKSSDAWFVLPKASNISMRYANIESWDDSILSLTQNEAGSTIYVLKWLAKVSNLAGIGTTLTHGQKISVSRINASKDDLDIAAEKWDIDSFFKSSDWFLDNDGPSIISQVEEEKEKTDEDVSDSKLESQNGTLSLTGLKDEMSTDKSNIEIQWKVLDAEVKSLTIDNKAVNINNDSFSHSIPLSGSIHDVVVKMFDKDKQVLAKEVYTVYSSASAASAPASTKADNTQNNANSNKVTDSKKESYTISSRDFVFTAPSVTGKFTTTSPEVTIRWKTTAKWITQVKVNGFKLASFNGSTWRYHAFKRFETLEEGTNQYKIDYYNEAGNVVYTDYFTITKKSAGSTLTPQKAEEEKVISDEASAS